MNNEWVFHRLADHQLFEDGYFFNLSELDHEGPVDTPPASPVYVNSAEPQIITYPRYGDFFIYHTANIYSFLLCPLSTVILLYVLH